MGDARWTLTVGDSADVLRTMPTAHSDSMVTDPPAGIGFMGKDWDKDRGGRSEWVAWLAGIMRESLRVLKPGAHALVWALPRTSHWTATAIEDAGFHVRDKIAHFFGNGFPKSMSLAPGVGTALKPGHEDWILARAPMVGTTTDNYAQHGTGGLQIDACRIAAGQEYADKCASVVGLDSNRNGVAYSEWGGARDDSTSPLGRWPGNVVMSHSVDCGETCTPDCPVRQLDEQSGDQRDGVAVNRNRDGVAKSRQIYGAYANIPGADVTFGGTGGASRFLYVAKPTREERDLGCEDLPLSTAAEAMGRKEGSAGLANARAGAMHGGARNTHATVKGIDLMRHLCKLVTPPGGRILDPFFGSGTTGCAAMVEGFDVDGIEHDTGHACIAWHRMRFWEGRQVAPGAGKVRAEVADPRQVSLFESGA